MNDSMLSTVDLQRKAMLESIRASQKICSQNEYRGRVYDTAKQIFINRITNHNKGNAFNSVSGIAEDCIKDAIDFENKFNEMRSNITEQ